MRIARDNVLKSLFRLLLSLFPSFLFLLLLLSLSLSSRVRSAPVLSSHLHSLNPHISPSLFFPPLHTHRSTSLHSVSKMSINQLSHPLLSTKLSELRDKRTPSHRFRSLIKDITGIVAIEASRDLELKDVPNVSLSSISFVVKEEKKRRECWFNHVPLSSPFPSVSSRARTNRSSGTV